MSSSSPAEDIFLLRANLLEKFESLYIAHSIRRIFVDSFDKV